MERSPLKVKRSPLKVREDSPPLVPCGVGWPPTVEPAEGEEEPTKVVEEPAEGEEEPTKVVEEPAATTPMEAIVHPGGEPTAVR